ncbi:MAG: potassium channel family protein [Acidobacteriota bacterium]
MRILAASAGVLLVLIVLWDGFETIVLARRVSRELRLTRFFYWATWRPYCLVSRFFPAGNRRENFLSVYGPMSLILLLVLWAVALVAGFALLQWGLGAGVEAPEGMNQFQAEVYLSGTNFFTLGLGDVRPLRSVGRLLTVLESGTGFAFLALIIGFLPGVSAAFSRRELNISLLDARAGSPPSATELLKRQCAEGHGADLKILLGDWERWSAELLESHISFPVLAYFRSQHDNQSWLSSLTAMLDTCALVIVGVDSASRQQARLTFAIARHAVVDMCNVLGQHPLPEPLQRISPDTLERVREELEHSGLAPARGAEADRKLDELRAMYEPYVGALSVHLLMPLPAWIRTDTVRENWLSRVREF